MTALIEERRRNPGDDVVSALVRGDPELPPLDDELLVGIVMMFISAGHNTTTSAIGNSVLRLARDAELQARVRAEPELIPAFVEEVVRVDAPQQAMRRVATADTELGGREIAAGDYVWLVFGSANLDPRRSSTPRGRPRAARPTATSASAGGSTSASARRSPGSSCGSPSRSSSHAPSSFALDGEVARPAWPRLGVDRLPLRFS